MMNGEWCLVSLYMQALIGHGRWRDANNIRSSQWGMEVDHRSRTGLDEGRRGGRKPSQAVDCGEEGKATVSMEENNVRFRCGGYEFWHRLNVQWLIDGESADRCSRNSMQWAEE
eukprot:Gb_17395 [translate_table: standard]